MSTFRQRAALFGCALFSGLVISGAGFAAQESPSAPLDGVWQKHEYNFAYMGFTSTYSCDGLADKIKLLLIAAGARKDATSRPGACAMGFGRPDKFARAYLTFYTLAPDSTASSAAGGTVAGIWRPIAFSDRSPREIRVGDCELIEQFRNNVLPMFATRGLDNHTTCIPHQETGSIIDLKFESFTAVPRPDAPH